MSASRQIMRTGFRIFLAMAALASATQVAIADPSYKSCQAPVSPIAPLPFGPPISDAIWNDYQAAMVRFTSEVENHRSCLNSVRDQRLVEDRKWVQPRSAIEITNELYNLEMKKLQQQLAQAEASYKAAAAKRSAQSNVVQASPEVQASGANAKQGSCRRLGAEMAHNEQVPGELWGGWAFFMLNREYPGVEDYSGVKVVGRAVLAYTRSCQVSSHRTGLAVCQALGANCVSVGGCLANSEMVVASPADGSWLFLGCGRDTTEAAANAVAQCERRSGCKCNPHKDSLAWYGVHRVAGSYHAQSCASLASANSSAVGDQVRQYPPREQLLIVPQGK
jgi:hypothetical protein